ncbi:spore germination protein GerPC [Ferdinandcohnia sp. Marseille-Q9671]
MDQQNQRINQLEEIIQYLQKEIDEIKNKPITRIDKIEYKFDQLKVETLEGTLNIGLNPMNGEQVEDFSVSQSKMNVPDVRHIHKDLINKVHDEIDTFLDHDCSNYIHGFLKQQRTTVSEEHVQFIIEDIRKQIDERIIIYLEQKQTELQDPNRENEISQSIVQMVKTDIQNSLDAYLGNLPENLKEGK